MAERQPDPDDDHTIDDTHWTCPGVALVAIALVVVVVAAAYLLFIGR